MGIGMSCCCTKGRQVCHACSTRSLNKKIAQRWPICFDRLTKKHRAGKKRKKGTTANMITRYMNIIESGWNLAQGTPGIWIYTGANLSAYIN